MEYSSDRFTIITITITSTELEIASEAQNAEHDKFETACRKRKT